MNLLAVHLNAHLVGSSDQVRVDLNLVLTLFSFFAFCLSFFALCILVGLLLPVLRLCRGHLHFSLVSVSENACHFVCELLRFFTLHSQTRVLLLAVIELVRDLFRLLVQVV